MNVNYEMISSGSHAEAARFFTGAPAREFKSNSQTIDELWGTLHLNLDECFIVTASCFIEHNGLIAGQGYIVKSFVVMKKSNGQEIRLLKIKNPFKQSENSNSEDNWTGKYGKKDAFWTAENMAKAGHLEDDEFYMAVEDFKDSFKSYTITYLRDGWQNSFVEKRNAVNKKVYKFNFSVNMSS